MDEGSDGGFRSIMRSLFKKNGHPLEEYIRDARDEGEIKGEEVSMLLNILDLGDKHVADIMIPRTDMACAEAKSSVLELAEVIMSLGNHSRIPIYAENKDHIIGIVHAKDLMGSLITGRLDASVTEMMRRPFFVSESTGLKSLLKAMQVNKNHMAIVQDEYGGVSGLVTMEDILEEIVGDINDEYDALKPDEVQKLEDGSLLVSGRFLLDDLKDRYNIDLDSEQVETIGGYISGLAGRIPAEGEIFKLSGFDATIKEADARQIKQILIQLNG